jgi:hypothetical protein
LNIPQVGVANISLFRGSLPAYLEHIIKPQRLGKRFTMSSIWTDLLFLHGYLIRKEELAWHPDAAPMPPPTNRPPVAPAPATTPARPTDCGKSACA